MSEKDEKQISREGLHETIVRLELERHEMKGQIEELEELQTELGSKYNELLANQSGRAEDYESLEEELGSQEKTIDEIHQALKDGSFRPITGYKTPVVDWVKELVREFTRMSENV
jgi:DNA repair exonuclease SbcCD ATPase subunit